MKVYIKFQGYREENYVDGYLGGVTTKKEKNSYWNYIEYELEEDKK